jgi:hypothetical protein
LRSLRGRWSQPSGDEPRTYAGDEERQREGDDDAFRVHGRASHIILPRVPRLQFSTQLALAQINIAIMRRANTTAKPRGNALYRAASSLTGNPLRGLAAHTLRCNRLGTGKAVADRIENLAERASEVGHRGNRSDPDQARDQDVFNQILTRLILHKYDKRRLDLLHEIFSSSTSRTPLSGAISDTVSNAANCEFHSIQLIELGSD